MNPATTIPRGPFQGVAEIISFNRHWYVGGAGAILAATTALAMFDWPVQIRVATIIALAVAVLWSVMSLAVSHWVYDRSPLRDWMWIKGALLTEPKRWCNIHCGLDESSASLKEIFPEAEAVVLDIFDPVEMTEPSIARARAMFPCNRALPADFQKLPIESGSSDAVLLLFAAHELRKRPAREQLMTEVRRVLCVGGEAIVAEHLRDFPNFCAFGPGAFHFFSRREWRRIFAAADFQCRREFNITPFVRVFVLRKES